MSENPDYVFIRFKLEQTGVDSTPYKIYSPLFKPADDIYVEIKLSKKYVISENPLILKPKGLALAFQQIATAISSVYGETDA